MKKTNLVVVIVVILAISMTLVACGGNDVSGTYTYTYQGMFGEETAQIVLDKDGKVQFSMKDNPMLTDVYAGTYTIEGNTVKIKGLKNVDTASPYPIPGLWEFIDATSGDGTLSIDTKAMTFAPVK